MRCGFFFGLDTETAGGAAMKTLIIRVASRLASPAGESYFFGCLGLALMILMISGQIRGDAVFQWLPLHLGVGFAWASVLALQLLTIALLMERLRRHRLQWAWAIALPSYWAAYDLLLIIGKSDNSFLALIYGFSQSIFLFDLHGPGRGGVADQIGSETPVSVQDEDVGCPKVSPPAD
jgi:hypothetical protein